MALNSREYPVSSFFLSILHFLSFFSLVISTCYITLYFYSSWSLSFSFFTLNFEFLRLFSFLYMFSILRSRIFFLSFFLDVLKFIYLFRQMSCKTLNWPTLTPNSYCIGWVSRLFSESNVFEHLEFNTEQGQNITF